MRREESAQFHAPFLPQHVGPGAWGGRDESDRLQSAGGGSAHINYSDPGWLGTRWGDTGKEAGEAEEGEGAISQSPGEEPSQSPGL